LGGFAHGNARLFFWDRGNDDDFAAGVKRGKLWNGKYRTSKDGFRWLLNRGVYCAGKALTKERRESQL
jgi:hypothetical protein